MKSGCTSLPGTELHPTALVMRLLLSEYAGSTQVSKVLAEKYTQLIFSDTCCSKRFIIQNLFLQQQVNAACDCKHGTLFFPHAVQEGNQSTQLWSQFRCWHWNEYKNKPNNNKNIHVTCIKYQHEISTSEGTVTRSYPTDKSNSATVNFSSSTIHNMTTGPDRFHVHQLQLNDWNFDLKQNKA